MNRFIICCLSLTMFFVSGCVVRTYTTEMDRVDQEIHGNRGVIMGTPPVVEDRGEVKKTREIYNVEVELPSSYKSLMEEKVKNKDKDLYGNRGYIQGNMIPEKEVYVPESGKEQVSVTRRISGGLSSLRMPQIVYSEPSRNAEIKELSPTTGDQKQYYVVKEGDTLQKISENFFGTTKKWKAIYNANKHVLKSPDRIRPGQKLVIPKE